MQTMVLAIEDDSYSSKLYFRDSCVQYMKIKLFISLLKNCDSMHLGLIDGSIDRVL